MVAITAIEQFIERLRLAPALIQQVVHGRHQPGAVCAVPAVQEHQPFFFFRADRLQGRDDVVVIHRPSVDFHAAGLDAAFSQPVVINQGR